MTCLSWSAEPSVGSPNAVATCRRYAPVSRFELSGSDRPRGTRSCSRAPEASASCSLISDPAYYSRSVVLVSRRTVQLLISPLAPDKSLQSPSTITLVLGTRTVLARSRGTAFPSCRRSRMVSVSHSPVSFSAFAPALRLRLVRISTGPPLLPCWLFKN